MTEPAYRLNAALSDRYRIERELGQGGMATVYLAEDLKHDRKVALKVLKPELAAVLGAERFVIEIKTTASLQHPHILPLFDSGTADGFLFYVMPFVQGETLRDKLTREKQLGVDEAVKIASEVADALQHAHEHGVIHRDIKPENILLANGRPMVADFGIALAVSAAAGGRMTETGLSLGTPHYMSPEQATAEKEITARSDVYSLASVLYEMLAGVPPHEGGSAQQTIMRIITETPRPVGDLRRAVPPHVEAAVMKGLEKLPADRFASAADFARALGDPSRLSSWQHPTRSGAVQADGRRPRWQVWVPTAVAVAMALIAARSFMTKPVAVPRTPLRYTLATMGGEDMFDLSISADGGTVVYPAMVNGAQRGYVRRLDALEPKLLPGAEGMFTAAVLPGGRSVVIANTRKQVILVPLDGGAARQLVTSTIPAQMSWSPSRGLVLGMPAYSDSIWGLSLVPPGGDTKLNVLTNNKPGTSMHHDPLVLADGVTVLYFDYVPKKGTGHLGIGSLESKTWTTTDLVIDGIVGYADGILVFRDGPTVKAVRLEPDTRQVIGEPVVVDGMPPGIDAIRMAANGTMVMHTVANRYQLELVNESGGGVAVIRDTISSVTPRFSPDGKQAALAAGLRSDGPAWVLDLGNRTVTKLGFTYADALDWTPDGRSIVASSMSRGLELLPANAGDGAKARSLMGASDTTRYSIASLTVARDGNSVVYGTAFGQGFNLMLRHLNGDTTTKTVLATPAVEVAPRFSPDGNWLAYSSDETGRHEVYVQPFPGPGRRVQVSTDGGVQPVWSADGRLFYRAGKTMMTAQLSRGADAAAVTSRRALFDGDFYGLGDLSTTYDVSPDGRQFLMARRIGTGTGQLIAWVDWLGDIKAKLGK